MCDECRRIPCAAQCPNAPDPVEIHKCPWCRYGITAGEEFIRVNGDYFHVDCLESMPTYYLMKLLGYSVEEAQGEET